MPSTKAALGKLYIQRDEAWKQRSNLDRESRRLGCLVSNLDARAFIIEHALSDEWVEVPRSDWEKLNIGEEVALVILRPKNTESVHFDIANVNSYGGWSRGISDGFRNFTAVEFSGKVLAPDKGVTVKIWRRASV